MSDTPNAWIPEDLLEYYRERAEGDENIVDVDHALRIVLRKHRLFEEGKLENPVEDLRLESITCHKCE